MWVCKKCKSTIEADCSASVYMKTSNINEGGCITDDVDIDDIHNMVSYGEYALSEDWTPSEYYCTKCDNVSDNVEDIGIWEE